MGIFSRKNKKVEEVETVQAVKAAPAEEGIPAEVVAVIAAAVTCMLGAGATIVGIRRSVRKSDGRAAWRNAGLLDNTRSF